MMVWTDPLPNDLRAEQDRPVVVLQRAGDDLAGRGGAAIDQHRHRKTGGDVAGARVVALRILAAPAAGRHDLALVEKRVRHRDRLIEQAARIVAQIEDHPDQLVAGLLLQVLHRVVEADIGLLVEGRDPDIADIVALEMGADRLDLDRRAGQLDVEGLLPFAPDRQLDLAVDEAAHLLDRLGQRHPLDRVAVEMGDQIAGLQPGARGRAYRRSATPP